VFRTVTWDDDALVGTVVIDFSHTIGVFAVDDTFRAGEIGKVKDVRRRRGMRDLTSHAVGGRKRDRAGPLHLSSAIPDYVIPAYTWQFGCV